MLDYEFTEEQEMFRQSLREYLQKSVAPHLPKMEEKQEITPEIMKAMAEFELLGPCVTEEYGGPGMDMIMAGLIGEELGRTDPTASVAVFYLVDASWSHVFCRYGTKEGKKEILPDVVKGKKYCGIATTEADVGSDVANMKTTIKKEGDHYIVNGDKNYISGVREAAQMGGGHVTLARQDLAAGAQGMTLFFLPLKDNPGITITTDRELGREGMSTGGFNINKVKVPAKYIIGEQNKGFYIVHEGYELARGIIALVCCGAAMKALENGINYIKQRKAFGRPIGKYEAIQWQLSEDYTKIQFVRDWAYKALHYYTKEAREGKPLRMQVSKYIAMAKMYAPLWAFDAINHSMQWQGAFGYNWECPEVKAFRAIRSFTLAEGSTEIMHLIIARELLGKDFIAYK
jgi:acyl-CoA dehydrogenase